jgi:hypothetical protein
MIVVSDCRLGSCDGVGMEWDSCFPGGLHPLEAWSWRPFEKIKDSQSAHFAYSRDDRHLDQ